MSVQRRPKEGKDAHGRVTWICRYYDPSGKQRSRSFPTKREAEAHDQEQARLLRRREWVDDGNAPTLAELWPTWEQTALSPGTKAVRVTAGKNLGDLATTKITRIRPAQLRAWQAHLRNGRPWEKGDDGVAANTAKSWWNQLSGCLSMAVVDGLLLVNPCSKVPGPAATYPIDPMTLPTLAEVGTAITRAKKTGRETLGMMMLLAVSTGLRSSEIGGLQWGCVDRQAQAILVRTRSRAVKGKPTDLGPVKTAASHRTVPVPADVVRELTAYRLAHPTDDGETIFQRRGGGLWSSDDIASATRALLGKDAGWTFHTLRHVYASGLIRAGRGVKAVQKMLGHKNAATTLDTYTHLWPDEDSMVRDAAADLVRDLQGISVDAADPSDEKSGTRSE